MRPLRALNDRGGRIAAGTGSTVIRLQTFLQRAIRSTPGVGAIAAAAAFSLAAAAPATDALFRDGVAALKDKRVDDARRHLSACTGLDPQRIDCHWELGWAHYLAGDWARVVEEWRTVKRLQPRHPEVDRHLATAEANLAALQQLEQRRAQAPASLPRSRPTAGRLRIRAVGDMMLGTSFPEGYLPPDDGAHLLDDVAPLLTDADLTFANLEGPLCDSGTSDKCSPGSNCYAFRSPTRYGEYYRQAGIDLLSTANNHAEDFGIECRLATEATLDRLGIAYSGRPGTIASVVRDGRRVAMIGFHSSRSGHYLNDHAGAAALVRQIKANHDVVIVSFHGGAEGAQMLHVPTGSETHLGENRGDLRAFARAVVDAGADLVLGHGPHVLRGAEVYRDRLILYSLGNFATYGRFALSGNLGIGAVVEVDLDEQGRFVGGKIFATRQIGRGIPVRDPDGVAIELMRRLSIEDFGERGIVVAGDGSFGRR